MSCSPDVSHSLHDITSLSPSTLPLLTQKLLSPSNAIMSHHSEMDATSTTSPPILFFPNTDPSDTVPIPIPVRTASGHSTPVAVSDAGPDAVAVPVKRFGALRTEGVGGRGGEGGGVERKEDPWEREDAELEARMSADARVAAAVKAEEAEKAEAAAVARRMLNEPREGEDESGGDWYEGVGGYGGDDGYAGGERALPERWDRPDLADDDTNGQFHPPQLLHQQHSSYAVISPDTDPDTNTNMLDTHKAHRQMQEKQHKQHKQRGARSRSSRLSRAVARHAAAVSISLCASTALFILSAPVTGGADTAWTVDGPVTDALAAAALTGRAAEVSVAWMGGFDGAYLTPSPFCFAFCLLFAFSLPCSSRGSGA